MTATTAPLTHQERAVLRAVAAGRCTFTGSALLVDGLGCCDQFIGSRLAEAGLIAGLPGPARLTGRGRALLGDAAGRS